ncbi:eotaxin-like [Puntigrus tetrazona]|uniref:eotaxin-like n=1 Tax=Puntigrus tetrazona TaxID=1606681 RepID=UPI001C896245|nr:eotaxin-like [Puntigrus tetrazona]
MMLIFTACVFWAILGSIGVFADERPVSCCLKIGRRKVSLDKVLNYRMQIRGLCPITAVVIQTVSGKRLCSDPSSDWTKRAMRKVDEAKKKTREQDPVPTEGASAERSRRRADAVTATELQLNSQQSDNMTSKRNSKIQPQVGPKEMKKMCKSKKV